MPIWSRISRADATAFAAGALLCALAGCGETTHTVGELRAAGTSTVRPPKGGATAGNTVVSSQGSGGTQEPADGGSAITGVADGGPFVEAPDANVVLASPFPECTGPARYALRRQLDLYFMVDNLTLPNFSAWASLVQGLRRDATDPRDFGTGVGVDYFGLDCDATKYNTPEVPVATLPTNARPVVESSIAQIPLNASPLLPAVQGAIAYAHAQAEAEATIKMAVVLITDGISDLNCGSSVTALTKATRDGAEGSPSIPTYIVAVDAATATVDIFNRSARFDPLEDMAVAGGTATVRDIDMQSEPTILNAMDPSPTANALVAIQREAEPCDINTALFNVPVDGNGEWLARYDDDAPTRLTQVSSIDDCDAHSFYFATERDVRWARLCDATCADVKDKRATLSWVDGCP